jgi:hypothetical protein
MSGSTGRECNEIVPEGSCYAIKANEMAVLAPKRIDVCITFKVFL